MSKQTQEQKAIAALELALPFGVFTLLSETVSPALERARVVGVLDAWRAAAVVPRKRAYELDEHGVLFLCEWQPLARMGQIRKGFEGTPDAARAAAAKAIEAGEV